MNILFQCSEYPPFRNGGIGTVTKVVAEELVRRGHNVSVCGYYSELPVRERVEEINGVTIYRFNKGTRKGAIRVFFFLLLNKIRLVGFLIQKELSWYEKKIDAIIRKNQIDVVEMTDFYNFNLYRAKLRYRRFDVPTVMRVHGSASFIQHFSGKNQAWVVDNDHRHFQRVDYLCSVSKFAEKYVKETFPDVFFRGEKVIYNSIESVFLKHNQPSSNKTILFIGKLIRTKGAYALAEAFNRIAVDFPDWSLHYAGTGEKALILNLLSPENREKVTFLGFCNREKLAQEIDSCAFACIPTYFENFSMVPLEIMGRTRTVIFTNRTSGKEIISDGIDGYTVDPENIEEISEKMKNLMKNPLLRDMMAEKSYSKIEKNFTTDVVTDMLEDFYNVVKRTVE